MGASAGAVRTLFVFLPLLLHPSSRSATALSVQHPVTKKLNVPTTAKPSKIRRGDYVVHSHIGIGIFEGLFEGIMVRSKTEKAVMSKYLKVKFRDRTLEVMLDQRSLLKLYRRKEDVQEEKPPRLDSTRSRANWKSRKTKAARDVLSIAGDLPAMYAEREHMERKPCPMDAGDRFRAFEATFEFEPTADQIKCFEDIRRDMCENERPMDRLICGDVGFGKTEAGMRAAYRAVCAGRQVAILAPTTLLAAQHLRTLRARMGSDVRIELLSSLVRRTAQERRALLSDLAAGKVDMLVGTHAILSPNITWASLGLLIIDEEQRFGVRQKEKIKKATLGVDCLSLSATPIPRTLYMCMAGIRDMTTLESPPIGRLAIRTTVTEHDWDLVADVIRREVNRGGQVFYVVPRIEHVKKDIEVLSDLLPEKRIVYAYSKVQNLEKRVLDFTLGEYDVLVSTTIMENGIDIPNVNTIIVQNTQMFGLAQLHQLRGRVGRGSAQAYAYLLHPERNLLAEDSLKRLDAMQQETALGAGFHLAKSDLQMRGAGTVFGTQQKGSTAAADIGIDMYMDVLRRAMVHIRKREEEGRGGQALEVEELMRELEIDEEKLMALSDSLQQD